MKLYRKLLVLLCLTLACSKFSPLTAQTKDTIKIGIFPESIYDLDFTNYSFSSNFWMWSVCKGDVNDDGKIDQSDSLAAIDRINLIELSNAKDYTYSRQTAARSIVKGNIYWWTTQFCKATLYEKWTLAKFPFDRQSLALKFESSSYDTSQVIMLNEMDSLTFKKDINLVGWKIDSTKIFARTVAYNTDFGDPNGNGKSAYSRVVYIMQLERLEATSFFIKLCLGVFIAFLVAVIVFLISPSSMDSRFGLGIGALFAATANKYVVDSNIPQTATTCLVDKIHEITFGYILLTLVASIVALMLHEKGRALARRNFDIIAGSVLLGTYIITVYCLWLQAHAHSAL